MLVFQQFFRRANHRKDEIGNLGQLSQFRLNECVGEVPAVSTKKYIHFVNRGEGDVSSVSVANLATLLYLVRFHCRTLFQRPRGGFSTLTRLSR